MKRLSGCRPSTGKTALYRLMQGWLLILTVLLSPWACAEKSLSIDTLVSKKTRLMVFSPHPDDESLGAGGLIQRVLSVGGKVKVVFMTSGDGYPEGVQMEDHLSYPTAKDYIGYGKQRQEEAREALATVGIKKEDVIFLGFPDGGLCFLLWKFRSDSYAYTSPFTKENHPPSSDIIIPNTEYTGYDLRKEIERVLADFHPNLLVFTAPEDQHPDHCSTYHFVREAFRDLGKKGPALKAKVLTFLIHFGQWPSGQGSGTGPHLNPPEGFPDKEASWVRFPLKTRETETKLKAILQYHSQMLVIGRYLLSFARANELFILEEKWMEKDMEKEPCCWK